MLGLNIKDCKRAEVVEFEDKIVCRSPLDTGIELVTETGIKGFMAARI